MTLPPILSTISKALQKYDARAIIVGGVVRDHFLGLASKDYDVEVYGLESLDVLEKVLGAFGSVNQVGKSFGVLKFVYEGEEYDFSFPRLETKVAEGHRGFDVDVDGTLTFEVAAKRRDFTINALGYDVHTKTYLDPFGGVEDIKAKRLRHIDAGTFVEDPLRVYRAVQFCARFEFDLDDATYTLCKEMVDQGMLDTLPKERVYTEWEKLLLKSRRPSMGFELMRAWGIVERYFPELHALIDLPQSPKWHPEGDVWVHTMMTLDAMADICSVECVDKDEKYKLRMMFALLCHDLGKAVTTTVDEEGTIRAIGHENAGVELTRTFMYRLMDEHDFIESLVPLVTHHLKPSQFFAQGAKASAIRRLSTKVNIEELVMVAKADFLGRTTEEALRGDFKAGSWLLEVASKLKVRTQAPARFIQGRDLIALGMEPSPEFKVIIDEVYTLQLDGEIESKEEALTYLQKKFR